MVTSKILNPERSGKIKENRETLASSLTRLSLSSSLAISSLSQASDSSSRQNFTEVKPSPAGLVFRWVTSKYATFVRNKGPKILF